MHMLPLFWPNTTHSATVLLQQTNIVQVNENRTNFISSELLGGNNQNA